MTQGDPLSPTIFNVVVDAVVLHWVTMAIAEAKKRRRGGGGEGKHQASLFYADDGMVASSEPRWLQWEFDTLFSLYDRLGLRTNVGNTVSMVCRPCQAAGSQLEAAYGRRMPGEGPTYRERQKGRFQYSDYGKDMGAESLASHRVTQYGRAAEERWSWESLATGGETQTYRMAFPTKGGTRSCPVEG